MTGRTSSAPSDGDGGGGGGGGGGGRGDVFTDAIIMAADELTIVVPDADIADIAADIAADLADTDTDIDESIARDLLHDRITPAIRYITADGTPVEQVAVDRARAPNHR